MAYLARAAIWQAIRERVEGTNTIAPRAMPATGATSIRVDRIAGADQSMNEWRSMGGAVASIPVPEIDRSAYAVSTPGSLQIYALKVVVQVSYNLTSEAARAPDYESVKALAGLHGDMLSQALCYPGVLAATVSAGKSETGSVLAPGTATGLVSGQLFPASPGFVVTSEGGGSPDTYEVEHHFTATAVVTAAIS